MRENTWSGRTALRSNFPSSGRALQTAHKTHGFTIFTLAKQSYGKAVLTNYVRTGRAYGSLPEALRKLQQMDDGFIQDIKGFCVAVVRNGVVSES